MIYHDVKQNSEEWFQLRLGKVTSSQMAVVMANLGKPFGDPAKRYALEIALERKLGRSVSEEVYQNAAMQRGHELEPIARELYERENFVVVKNGGFFEHEKTGDSPDGLVGEDGVVEIKSVYFNTHFKLLKEGGYDSKYKYQVHFHIWKTGRKWCDFVSFCPEMPEDKQLYTFRVHRDEEIIVQMDARLNQFERMVEENLRFL